MTRGNVSISPTGAHLNGPQTIYLGTLDEAIPVCRKKASPGLIWYKVRNHWRIVGNYDGKGRVWNGEGTQIVPATAADMKWLAEHKM